jgi:hypothetical protein
MADLPSSLRPETRPEAATYRPLSGLAVAALIVSGLGAAVIAILAVAARLSSKPVLYPWVLILPLAGVALAVAAQWHLRRAEGTRVGAGLAAAGLWLGVLFGGGYGAYCLATEMAVRQQARAAVGQFFDLLDKDEVERAFRLTLAPGQQQTITEDDRDGIRRRFGAQELAGFERSELVKMCRQWRGKTAVDFQGVRERDVLPTGFQMDMDYRVRNPEGHTFISIQMLGHDDPASGARIWQVQFGRTFVRDRLVNRLGRLYQEIQARSSQYLSGWAKQLYNGEVNVSGLLLVDGKPPDSARKEVLEGQLKAPGSLTLFPGSTLRPYVPPTIVAKADAIDALFGIEARLPALGDMKPAVLTVRLTGPDLVAEVQRLQGENWAQEPLLERANEAPELEPYKNKIQFKVIEINVTPDAPRAGPRMVQQPGEPS